jgi:NADH-quinone oxidoreductase subunit J
MDSINNWLGGGGATDALFYLLATLMVVCAAMVIVSRSPVTSAMFLVLTILSMSGLFVLLHAFFLAAVQIIVYAGAVLVLFVFVIMLLDLKEEARRKIKFFGIVMGIVAVGGIFSAFTKSLGSLKPLTESPQVEGDTISLGKLLFSHYTLPFEVVSVLLLVAMIGVILLSKKKME